MSRVFSTNITVNQAHTSFQNHMRNSIYTRHVSFFFLEVSTNPINCPSKSLAIKKLRFTLKFFVCDFLSKLNQKIDLNVEKIHVTEKMEANKSSSLHFQ